MADEPNVNDNDNKDEGNQEPGDITLTINGSEVTKTMDELKDLATRALSGDETRTFTLKVDGQEKDYTLKELIDSAQKAAGADAKLERASGDLKKAARGIRIMELLDDLRKSENPDEEKLAEFMREAGASKEEIEAQIAQLKGKDGKQKPTPSAKKLSLEDLDDELKGILIEAQKSTLSDIRTKIEAECKEGVDNDKVLGNIIDRVQDDTRKSKVRQVLHDMVVEDVRGRILAREPFGPEMIRSSLQKVRARVDTFGIPANAAGTGPVLPEGLAAAAAQMPEIQETEPIKRVSSDDPDYEDVFLKRAQQKMIKAAQNLGRK